MYHIFFIYFSINGHLGCFHVFISVQLLCHLQFFVTPWTAARQASLSITNFWSLLKLMCIELAMLSNHLILCCLLLLLPSIFPSIRVFSNESALCIRWPKCWSFSFSISLSNEHSGLISFRMDWFDLLATVYSSAMWKFIQSVNQSISTEQDFIENLFCALCWKEFFRSWSLESRRRT